jgi:hypothetical protein
MAFFKSHEQLLILLGNRGALGWSHSVFPGNRAGQVTVVVSGKDTAETGNNDPAIVTGIAVILNLVALQLGEDGPLRLRLALLGINAVAADNASAVSLNGSGKAREGGVCLATGAQVVDASIDSVTFTAIL